MTETEEKKMENLYTQLRNRKVKEGNYEVGNQISYNEVLSVCGQWCFSEDILYIASNFKMEEWEGENKRERTKVIHWLRPLPPSPHPYSMWFRVYSQLPSTKEINKNADL